MLALVLSGAGNFGALQVGALEVLVRGGIRPDLIVGTSAGALNAVYLASNPSSAGVRRLARAWKEVGEDEIGMPSLLSGVRRVIRRRDGLINSQSLAEFLRQQLPPDLVTFGQLRALHDIPAYAVAMCMETAKLMIFGDREEDLLVDGMMASAAIPPYFPPWEVEGKRYLDGGILSKLPVRAAMERGATHVIALNVKYTYGTIESAHGMIGISSYSLSLMMEHQTIREMEWVTSAGIPVYCIDLTIPSEMQFWDYAQPDRLIQRGKELTQEKLASEPITLRPDWRLWIDRIAARLRGRNWTTKLNRES